MKLSKNLQNLIKSEIDEFNLINILQEEEYVDENNEPLICLHCDNEEIEKYHKVDINTLDENIQKQIYEICPNLDTTIITFWICKNCKEVIAVKLYSHSSRSEKKIYYSRFDSFNEVLKELKEHKYIDIHSHEPFVCWYCYCDDINIHKNENKEIIATCPDCGKILGNKISDIWRINANRI